MTTTQVKRGSSIAILSMEKFDDDATAQWLHQTFVRNGIAPTRGVNYLIAHFRATTALSLNLIVAEFLAARSRSANSALFAILCA